jgi:hypothetical protein
MSYKDIKITNEYARLSMAILAAKKKGLDISELLVQREQLKLLTKKKVIRVINNEKVIKDINDRVINDKQPRIRTIKTKGLFDNQLLETFLSEVKQIKEQNNLLQYDIK